jgi:hypothetical protein
MSIIKFGLRKFGTFKWGQPNRFYIFDSLLQYLPVFIERNAVCLALFRALAIVLVRWHFAVKKLLTYRLSGMPGLKYANENWKLFLNNNTPDGDIAGYIKQTYRVHQARGTKSGISGDLKRLSGDSNAAVEYYDEASCGWWLDVTYPDISPDGITGKYNEVASYIDLDNMLIARLYNYSGFTDELLNKIIDHEIIPKALNSLVMILKPLPLKWGRFKFGLRKFGQLIYPH